MGYEKYHFNETMTDAMLNTFEKSPTGTGPYHYTSPYYAGEWLVWHIPTYHSDGYYTYATTSHARTDDDPKDSSYEDGDKHDYYYNFNAITGVNFLNHSGYNSVGLFVGDKTTANDLTFGRGDVSAGDSATLSNLTFTSGGTVVLGDTFSDREGDNTVWYATTDARLRTMKANQDFDYVVALNGASSFIKDVEIGRNMRDLSIAAPGGSYGFSASRIDGNGTVVSQVKVGGRLNSVYVGKGAVLDTLNVGSQRSWGAGDVSAFGYFSSSYAGSGGRWVLSSATYMTVDSGGTATNIHLENGGQVTVMGPSTLVTSTYNSATSQWVVTSSEGSGAGGTLSHLFMATSGGLKFDGLADHETWIYPSNGYSNSSSYMSGFLATAPQSAYVVFESNTVGSNINIGNGGSMRINSGASVVGISMGALTTSTYYTNKSGTTDMWIGDRGAKLTMNGGFASNVIVEAAPQTFDYYSAAHNHFTTLSSSIGESMQNAYYSAHGEYPTWNDAWRQQIYNSASAGYRQYMSSRYQSAYQSNYDRYVGGEVNVHNAAIVKLSGFGTLTAVHYGSSGLSNGDYYYSAYTMGNITSASGALSATVNVAGGAHLSSVTVLGGQVIMGYDSGGITRMTGMENPQSNFAWVENLNLRTSGLVGDNNSAVIIFGGYNYSNTISIPVISNGSQVYTSDGYASRSYFSYDCIDPGEIQYASGDSGLTVQGTYGRFTYMGTGGIVIGGLGTVWKEEAGSRYYSSTTISSGGSTYRTITRWLDPFSTHYEFGVVKGVIDEDTGKVLRIYEMNGDGGFDWLGTLAVGSGAVVKDIGSKNGLKTANTLTSDSWNPVIEEDVSKKLVVLAGGSADNVAVTGKVTNYEVTSQYLYQSNAALVVSSGGTATNISVLSNGIAMAVGGTINGAFVGSGGILYLSGWGGAIQVSSDGGQTIAGAQYLDETVLNNVHLDKGGQLGAIYEYQFGGKAPSVIANTGGGVLNGITANGVAYMSGVDFAGGVNLGAGQQAIDVTVRGFTKVTSSDANGNPTAWTTTIAYMNVSSGGIVNGATVGEDGALYVSDGANVKNLVASGGRLIFGNSSGWSDYFPGSATVSGITVLDGGILEVNSKFALTATQMQIKESAGLELTIVKNADEDYAKTELNGTWTAGWGSGQFRTVDGVLSGFGGQFGFEYTDPIYGSKYTSARLSMTFLNGAVLDGGDLRGYGYFSVRNGAKVLNTKIKGITANIGASGYASGLSAITDPTNSAYQTNIYVYGSDAVADKTVLNGGYLGVERGGVVNDVTMLAPEGYEGPLGDDKEVGPAELDVMAGGTANNVIASAGVITMYEGSKEPGTGPSTLSNADVHSAATLIVKADGAVLDGTLNLGGTVVTTVKRYEYVPIEVTDPGTGDTYTDYQRIEKNNAVANASTLTVNFDLTERMGDEEAVMIDNLANLQGAKLGTITVSADQDSGKYVLAGGAEAFEGTLTVIEGTRNLGTISVGGYIQASEEVTYKLAKDNDNNLVFSVLTTDAAVTDIIATVDGEKLLKNRWTNKAVNIKVETNNYAKSIWYRIRKAIGTRGYDEWLELDNEAGLTISERCEVDFKAIDDNGKESKVVTYTVNYDDVPATIADIEYNKIGKTYLDSGDSCWVGFNVQDDTDDEPLVELSTDNGETWEEVMGWDAYHEFEVTDNGTYLVRTTDHAGNVSVTPLVIDFYNMPAVTVASPDGIAWEGRPDTAVVVALADETGGSVEFALAQNDTSISFYNMPGGEYDVQVAYAGGAETEFHQATITQNAEYVPAVWEAADDGVTDVFFAQSIGVWGEPYLARHMGIKDGWAGTLDTVELAGKNRLADLFVGGAEDANILLLTDDDNGDTLFVDDLVTELPGTLEAQQARIAQIKEIRAGAGDDVVDLTSQRFDYVGDGMTVKGGDGDDVIWSNQGDNWLFGDKGDDSIIGASGNDVIVGGAGNDTLHGGGGNDIFAFGGDWGNDTVTQLAGGKVTLWFENGNIFKWNSHTLTYTDGDNSVKVEGVSSFNITLKFGDDGSEQYQNLLASGAFDTFTSENIFENKNKGMLA